jgi:hypothetical protein
MAYGTGQPATDILMYLLEIAIRTTQQINFSQEGVRQVALGREGDPAEAAAEQIHTAGYKF